MSASHDPNQTAARLRIDTPVGELVVIHRDGVVLSCGWDETEHDQLQFIHPSIRPAFLEEDQDDTHGITQAVDAFFAGKVAAITTVPIKQIGGPFTQQVWAAMREIPAGETVSYAELAAMAGNQMAFRAAATACARNPIALFVPCHRVTASGGKPGGYRYGLNIKEHLLEIESRL